MRPFGYVLPMARNAFLSIQNGKSIRVEAGELLAEFVEPRLGNTGWVDFDNNRQWNDLGAR